MQAWRSVSLVNKTRSNSVSSVRVCSPCSSAALETDGVDKDVVDGRQFCVHGVMIPEKGDLSDISSFQVMDTLEKQKFESSLSFLNQFLCNVSTRFQFLCKLCPPDSVAWLTLTCSSRTQSDQHPRVLFLW
jgi:hypothetical protein